MPRRAGARRARRAPGAQRRAGACDRRHRHGGNRASGGRRGPGGPCSSTPASARTNAQRRARVGAVPAQGRRGIVLTHRHGDHACGAPSLARAQRPLFCATASSHRARPPQGRDAALRAGRPSPSRFSPSRRCRCRTTRPRWPCASRRTGDFGVVAISERARGPRRCSVAATPRSSRRTTARPLERGPYPKLRARSPAPSLPVEQTSGQLAARSRARLRTLVLGHVRRQQPPRSRARRGRRAGGAPRRRGGGARGGAAPRDRRDPARLVLRRRTGREPRLSSRRLGAPSGPAARSAVPRPRWLFPPDPTICRGEPP